MGEVAPPAPVRRIDRLTSGSGLFLTAVLLLSVIAVTRAIDDPDFWWHLKAGQLLVDQHKLLGTDPFTYTASTHVWVMHEWLTEVSFALLYKLGGIGTIVVALTLVTVMGIVFIWRRAALEPSHKIWIGIGLVLGILTGYPIWGPRAQMITFALSCLVLFVAERHLIRGGKVIWWLVPLFFLWSNLHSGFVIGLGFMALLFVAELIGRLVKWPGGAPTDRIKILGLVILAGAVAGMINPNGPGILLYPLGTQGSPAQQLFINEWQSPNFAETLLYPFLFMLVSLVGLIIYNRRIRAREAALVGATIAMALNSVRHIALFVAATTPVWISQADLAWRNVARRKRLRPRPLPPRPFRVALFCLVIAVLAVFDIGDVANSAKIGEDDVRYAKGMPLCATRWLLDARQPKSLNIFNQYGEGGFLSYRLHGTTNDRIFIFGDAALMGDDLLYLYAGVIDVQNQWNKILTNSGTDIVLFDTGTPLANMMLQSKRWTRVYVDRENIAFAPSGRVRYMGLVPQQDVQSARQGVCALMQLGVPN